MADRLIERLWTWKEGAAQGLRKKWWLWPVGFAIDLFWHKICGDTNDYLSLHGPRMIASIISHVPSDPVSLAVITALVILIGLVCHAYFEARTVGHKPHSWFEVRAVGIVQPPDEQVRSLNKEIETRTEELSNKQREIDLLNQQLELAVQNRSAERTANAANKEKIERLTRELTFARSTLNEERKARTLVIKSAKYTADDGSDVVDCTDTVKGYINGNAINMMVSDDILLPAKNVLATLAITSPFRRRRMLKVVYTFGDLPERDVVRFQGSRLILPDVPLDG